MANIDSIQDLHFHLDLVCTSLEMLTRFAADEHEEFIIAAQPAMLLFRELLDVGAEKGFAR